MSRRDPYEWDPHREREAVWAHEWLQTELNLLKQQLDMIDAGTFVKYNPDDTDEWLRENIEKRIVVITTQLVTG